jgi:hypothetical protein
VRRGVLSSWSFFGLLLWLPPATDEAWRCCWTPIACRDSRLAVARGEQIDHILSTQRSHQELLSIRGEPISF